TYLHYRVLVAENPDEPERNPKVTVDVQTTLEATAGQPGRRTRTMWLEPGRQDQDAPDGRNPFPSKCPRCNAWYNRDTGREIIEPVRTKGHQSFTVLLEDAFRLQPGRRRKDTQGVSSADKDDWADWGD